MPINGMHGEAGREPDKPAVPPVKEAVLAIINWDATPKSTGMLNRGRGFDSRRAHHLSNDNRQLPDQVPWT